MKFFEKVVDLLKSIIFSEDETIEAAGEQPPKVGETPDELDSPEGWK